MPFPAFYHYLAARSPQPSASAAATPPVDNLRLVFNGGVVLLSFFAFFVVVSIPRAFVRLSSGWRQGHILWSVSDDPKDRKVPSSIDDSTEKDADADVKSADSHTAYSHTDLVRHENGDVSSAFPHHIPTYSSILHPIASILRRRVMPGFSAGQALILGIYTSALVYVSLYMSNIFTDLKRSGLVAMSQIPFVFAFATKNNLWGMLVGLGYEKVRFIFSYC
jgi:ferric-chelate reductase